MKKMNKKITVTLFLLTALLAPALSAQALDLLGFSFPEETAVGAERLMLNGTGIRRATFLKVKVYAAALYVPQKSSERAAVVAQPGSKQIRLGFVRAVDKSKFATTWEESLAANNDAAALYLPGLRALLEGLADVKEGELLTLTVNEQGATLESRSGYVKTVSAPGLGAALLKIWIGPNPPDEGLQSGLLGRIE